jgi:hypothetical protein
LNLPVAGDGLGGLGVGKSAAEETGQREQQREVQSGAHGQYFTPVDARGMIIFLV